MIRLGPDGIDRDVYLRVVRDRQRIEIADETLAAVDTARARMLSHIEAGSPAYGVTSGLGHLAGIGVGEAEQDALQRSLLTARAAGLGPALPADVVRGAMLVRLTGFLSGTVGVSADACRFLAARIDDGWSPVVPQGPYGAPGEIGPLAHLFQTFVGEGLVDLGDGDVVTAAEALRRGGIEAFVPKSKEGLALIGGSPLATALAIRLADRFRTLLDAATTAAALGVALTGSSARALSERVAALSGAETQRRVCRRVVELLEREPVWESMVQPPVSTRILLQVHGAALGAIDALDDVVAGRLLAITDSPLFLVDDGSEGMFPSGGFHALDATLALETLGIAASHVLNLVEKRLHRLLDTRYSRLPDQLTRSPGVQAGVVALHKTVVGLTASTRMLAAPASVNAMDTSTGQEDVQSFGFLVAERLDRALDDLEAAIACELVALRQAAALRASPLHSPQLLATLEALVAVVPPFDEDRSPSDDIRRVHALVRRGSFGSPTSALASSSYEVAPAG